MPLDTKLNDKAGKVLWPQMGLNIEIILVQGKMCLQVTVIMLALGDMCLILTINDAEKFVSNIICHNLTIS